MSDSATPGIEDVLFKQGILFDLDIGRWAAIKKLDKDDLHLSSVNPNAFHLGHKKLMPKETIDKVYEIESKARSTLMACSSDFPIAGARFVRYPVLEQLLKNLGELKVKFFAEVKDLLQNYPILRAKQLSILNAQSESIATVKKLEMLGKQEALDEVDVWLKRQFARNEAAFPKVEDLNTKFHFEWRMFKVSSADSLSIISADQAIEAHKKLQGDLQEWVHETATMMHQTLGEAAKHANELLEKQGKLNPKNLKPLFDAFEAFKAIDFTGSDVQKKLDDIKKQYAYVSGGKIDYEASANAINADVHAMSGLKSLLTNLGELAVEEVATAEGEKALSKITGYGRVIDNE